MNFTRIITDFFVRRYLEKARICFSAYNIWNFKIGIFRCCIDYQRRVNVAANFALKEKRTKRKTFFAKTRDHVMLTRAVWPKK